MAERKVVFSRRADQRLTELYDYIADNGSPISAIGYVRRIRELCLALADFPERGVSRAEVRPGLRVLTMGRRVTIVYRVLRSKIVIVTIAYAGRNYTRELTRERRSRDR